MIFVYILLIDVCYVPYKYSPWQTILSLFESKTDDCLHHCHVTWNGPSLCTKAALWRQMDVNICSDNKWSLNDKLEKKNPYWKHKENTKELFGKKKYSKHKYTLFTLGCGQCIAAKKNLCFNSSSLQQQWTHVPRSNLLCHAYWVVCWLWPHI